ncbi:MAG: pectate lyase [Bacteroidales bacterium]|nr:pectate lyase [Bacteroidales bacterium]
MSEAASITASTQKEEEEPQPHVDPPVEGSIKYADFGIPETDEDGHARAFPGAQGGGMYATGGRGGKVFHVTNLNDSGAGSLRAAINEKGPRTIVFDVAGIISLNSTLIIKNGDVTIAGQTAPGDGICLKDYTFRINASNVIVRFIRCRMGDETKTEDDAIQIMDHDDDKFTDVVIDHCSVSWSTDECASFYGMKNFTFSWNIVSESLRNSVHGKGAHGYGGIWGGTNATYHHNLLAHHDSRNPRIDHDFVSTQKGPVSIVNNVIYNWSGNTCYGGESANDRDEYRKYNIINNYFKPGPASKASGKIRFLDPTTSCSKCVKAMGTSTIVPGHFYMDGNYMDGYPEMTADNWTGTTANEELIARIKASVPFKDAAYPYLLGVHSSAECYSAVLECAGASLDRDRIDERIARETRNGSCTYSGSNGSRNGLIDTQEDVGGWPAYQATDAETAQNADADADGMPDWFEEAAGLDKSNPADSPARGLDPSGRYTNLEMYLHYIVRDIVAKQNIPHIITQF